MIKQILVKLGLAGKTVKVIHYDGLTIYVRWKEKNQVHSTKGALVDGEWKSLMTTQHLKA